MKKLARLLKILGSAAFGTAVVSVGQVLAQTQDTSTTTTILGPAKAPEPSAFVLLATGLGGVAWWLFKRK